MTITENSPHTGGPADWRPVQQEQPRPPLWRRPVAIGAAAALLAAGVGGGLWFTRGGSDGVPSGPANAPASLPDTLGDLKQADSATAKGQQRAFEEKAEQLGDVTVVGRTYTSEKGRRTVKVVVGRTDLTGKLELAWPADKGRQVGQAHCTSNLQLTPTSKPAVRKTMLLCWRTSAALSAYAVIIDFDKTPKDSEGVEALMEGWRSAT